MLTERFGIEYREHIKHSKKLVPFFVLGLKQSLTQRS